MISFDKSEIKNQLDINDIFDFLNEYGGEPQFRGDEIIISKTICHHDLLDDASHKLYYYENSKLFQCFTGGCEESSFDIFELVMKVFHHQEKKEVDLNDAVRFIAFKYGILNELDDDSFQKGKKEDWKILDVYSRIAEINYEKKTVELKPYDDLILSRFKYDLILEPWLNEGISQEVLGEARIGFFPGQDVITIPHYDKNGKFIGLRGRTMCKEEAEKYGKYRPIRVLNTLFSHPLGMNLYNLNLSKNNIEKYKKAIVFESEKSTLKYRSYFGKDNDISVACCGSNFSIQQFQLLQDLGVNEICIAFDRQFQELGDKEFDKLTKHLIKLNEKFKKEVLVSFIFDKEMITGYKDAPIDKDAETFIKLYNERIIL